MKDNFPKQSQSQAERWRAMTDLMKTDPVFARPAWVAEIAIHFLVRTELH